MLPELYDEEVTFDTDRPALENPLDARRTMIAIAIAERDAKKTKELRDAVKGTYDDQIQKLERRAADLRSSLQAYVERFGEPTKAGGRSVKFPDVGTAYLAKADPKVEIADLDEVKARYASMFTREVFDETDFKRWAIEQATGETGEIPAGVNLVPGGPRLQIRAR